jgi:hypothetical protein
MELRSHPLMKYRGIANWPPTWSKRRGGVDLFRRNTFKDVLHGEIGMLKEVIPSQIDPRTRIFLVMDLEGNSYMGTLLFGDAAFGLHITAVLRGQLGKLIKEIGDLELSYTL